MKPLNIKKNRLFPPILASYQGVKRRVETLIVRALENNDRSKSATTVVMPSHDLILARGKFQSYIVQFCYKIFPLKTN